jgi:hypothetical protein
VLRAAADHMLHSGPRDAVLRLYLRLVEPFFGCAERVAELDRLREVGATGTVCGWGAAIRARRWPGGRKRGRVLVLWLVESAVLQLRSAAVTTWGAWLGGGLEGGKVGGSEEREDGSLRVLPPMDVIACCLTGPHACRLFGPHRRRRLRTGTQTWPTRGAAARSRTGPTRWTTPQGGRTTVRDAAKQGAGSSGSCCLTLMILVLMLCLSCQLAALLHGLPLFCKTKRRRQRSDGNGTR